MQKRHLVSFVLVFFGLLNSFAWVQAADLQVVTTFSILEDFVRQVGGTKVEVTSLVPFGADPHAWEPTPKEARLVAEANLLVANGGGFDQWLLDLQKSAAQKDTPVVIASEGLVSLAGHHDHGGDPHFWLSVPNAIHYVENITMALIKLSPADQEYFSARSRAYIEKLEELDHRLLEELGQIPAANRVIVAYHNAFSYLAERYGFAVVEFLVENPEAEPVAKDLARLVQLIKQQPRAVVFTEPQLNVGKRYVQTLANEAKAEIFVLYSDSLDSEVTTYLELMEHNGATLVEALR